MRFNSAFKGLSKNVVWFHGTHMCNFIYAHKKYSANFHETHTCPTALCTDLVPNFTQKRITDIESTHRNCALKTFNVYKNSHSLHILVIPSSEFLSKSDKTCRKEGSQLLGNVRLAVQIFTNQTAKQHYMECFYAAFHPKLDNKYQ
jgi:hypothetical protein